MSAGFEFPTYGRGVDPSPDLDFGFMFRHPDEKIGCVAPQKIIYEQKFEDFLKNKLQAEIEKKRHQLKSGETEIPDIIKFLKEEFLRLTRKTATRLEKDVFIAELKKNPLLAEVFGFDENTKEREIEEQIENIGSDEGINMDEFLLFYQISKNNLLKPYNSKAESQSSVTNDSFMEQNKQKTDDMSRIIEGYKPKIRKIYKKAEIMLEGEVRRQAFVEKIKENQVIMEELQEIIAELSSNAVNADTLLEEIISKPDERFTLLNFFDHFVFILTFARIQLESYLQETLLEEENLALFEELFNTMPKENNGSIVTLDFFEMLSKNDNVTRILDAPSREPKEVSEIPKETIGQTLERIYLEAPEHISWDEFKAYFTVKGRPDKDIEIEYINKKEENKSKNQVKPKGTKYAITVPEPFKFDRREKRKGMSIRERRLKEMLEQKEKEIKESIKITYKATPVPPEVKIPLYEQIMKEQEARRMQVKQNSIAITKANEKPFSFYYRDLTKTKPERPEMPKHVFTANPVPWTTSVPLYDKIVSERELARKERMSKAAIESLNLAMMPPRMELYYRQLQQKATKTPQPKIKTKKFKAKAVPNFRRLQGEFQQTLDACKQSFKPTTPEPFTFNETQTSFDYLKLLDKEADANKKWGEPSKAKRSKSLSILNKPKIIPSTTEKTKAMIEYKLAQKREAKMKEALKMQEEEERRMKHEIMRRVVQNCALIKDNTAELKERREESIKKRRAEIEEKEREYYEQKAEIYENVRKRPLLVEQAAVKHLEKQLEQLGPVRELLSQEESNEYSQDMLNQSY